MKTLLLVCVIQIMTIISRTKLLESSLFGNVVQTHWCVRPSDHRTCLACGADILRDQYKACRFIPLYDFLQQSKRAVVTLSHLGKQRSAINLAGTS